MFITFEGIDGSGKSTILKMLKSYLLKSYPNKEFVFTWEPGGFEVPESESIRQLLLKNGNRISPLAEAMLYASSRRIHLDNLILPSLEKNKIVISDRYVDSSYVYQGIARNLGVDLVKKLNDIATNKFIPKYTFFLTISKGEAKKRREKRKTWDRLDLSSENFFESVYDGYHKVANLPENKNRYITIDAEKNIDEVFEDVIQKFKIILEN